MSHLPKEESGKLFPHAQLFPKNGIFRKLRDGCDFYVELDEKEADSTQVLWGNGVSDKLKGLPKGTVIKFDIFLLQQDYAIGIPVKNTL